MSSSNEIAALTARVDQIERWIQRVTRQRPAVTEENSFELVSFDVKEVRTGAVPTYAYKLLVRNLTDRRLIMGAKVAFMDREGFVLEESHISSFTVQAAQHLATSGQATILNGSDPSAVADIKAVLQVIG